LTDQAEGSRRWRSEMFECPSRSRRNDVPRWQWRSGRSVSRRTAGSAGGIDSAIE
jgi:hypothetical protein